MRNILLVTSLFLVSCAATESSKIRRADRPVLENLQKHVTFLAADELQGRRTGTEGEKKAADYIAAEFKSIGLVPKGSKDYFQEFKINDGKAIDSSTHFIINGERLAVGRDFFPFAFSPDINMEALPAVSVQEADMPWIIDLKELLELNKNNPHVDLLSKIKQQTNAAKDKGASAIILYNSTQTADNLHFDPRDRGDTTGIPVIYVTKSASKKYFSDESATLDIKLKIDIEEKFRFGRNVVGYINNGANTTVILGAHFDHLGYGEDKNSMYRGDEKLIHNGADDNASGTAAIIELARMLKGSPVRNSNFIFIAFSGEELGLFGSKYFVENPTVDLRTVNYMINMDMVGRMNDSTKAVTVGGYGTSPAWSGVIRNEKKNAFFIKIDSSGTGPSDHTSFYRKDIPVLFYFTGLHTDYHKPSDDADKINYNGQLAIMRHIYGVIAAVAESNSRIAFTKTREAQMSTSARFSVSLGIMPDYTFSGNGVRVDGVTEGRPAKGAGILAGDIIVSLGEHSVSSMEAYMQSLTKFKKGDKTKVTWIRGGKTMSADIQF